MEQKELVMEGGVVGIGINLVCLHPLLTSLLVPVAWLCTSMLLLQQQLQHLSQKLFS